ncbi:MAG: DUF5106 domain-containing protein [Dysgonamonadaceae bacterium]|nr:DUF5106 domain-containing protein [Dysgonamonadaceae bacterium]
MKHRNFLTTVFLFALFIGVSCTPNKKAQAEAPENEEQGFEAQSIVPDTFVLPTVPAVITQPKARYEYLSTHFWDRFDFTNRNLIGDDNFLEQALVDYLAVLRSIPPQKVSPSVVYTLKKAEADSVMYAHFAKFFEKYLHDPNSPVRNEDFYIAILQNLVKSPVLSDADKSKYNFQLEMVFKNRVGKIATDFTFTTASGHKATLHSLASEYLLMIFFDPDCPSCKENIKYLNESQAIQHALSLNTPGRTLLTIVTVYTEGNVGEWKAKLNNLPGNWINVYDAERAIVNKKLYDIRAIPTIYLLNKDKIVLQKDVTAEMAESFIGQLR